MAPSRQNETPPADSTVASSGQRYAPFKDEESPGKPQTRAQIPILTPLNFYIGVTLSLCGVGTSSSSWVMVDGGSSGSVVTDVSLEGRHRTLARLGPWAACTIEDHCNKPWIVASGLDEGSVRGTQLMLTLALLTYSVGACVIVLQILRPRCMIDRCAGLLTTAVAECLFPIAAVLAFLSMLMMGELKRRLILRVDQTSRPGWAFIVCLLAVLANVTGCLCMLFNRRSSGCSQGSLRLTRFQHWPGRPITRGRRVDDTVGRAPGPLPGISHY